MSERSSVVATVWAKYAEVVTEPCDGVALVIKGKFEDMNIRRMQEVEIEINRRISEQVPFLDAHEVSHIIENPVTEAMIRAVNDVVSREFSDVLMMVTLTHSELERVLKSKSNRPKA